MNPLSDNDNITPPLLEINNQNPPQNEKTSTISNKVFDEMMHAFKDNEDENENLLSQIGDKIAENMLPIPSNSPFADTDMVIFKDDYRGYLPPNGIRESDLKLISKIYTDIASNDSNIKISSELPAFQKEILLSIKTLLTREIGRKLINKLIDLKNPIEITPSNKQAADINKIYLDLSKEVSIINIHPSGKLTYSTLPGFLVLGHEMIHIVHQWWITKDKHNQPTLGLEGVDYTDLEEQITITGLKNVLNTNFNEDGDDWKPINQDYNELNERNLTAAFTGSLTEYHSKDEKHRLPRVGHKGIDTESVPKMIRQLIMQNILYDFEKLIKDKSITKESLNSMFDPGDMHALALQYGKGEILKLLMTIDPHPKIPKENAEWIMFTLIRSFESDAFMKLIHEEKSVTKEVINSMFDSGELHAFAIEFFNVVALKRLIAIDPTPITKEGKSLLHIAAKWAKKLPPELLYSIIDAILETEIDVNLRDLEGNTALHYFTHLDPVNPGAIQKLVNRGAKYTQ